MSEGIEKARKAVKSAWEKAAKPVMDLDKDVWHQIKKDADVKKTKWFQSGSSIGPNIVKAQTACTKFANQINARNRMSVVDALTKLRTECAGFMGKHADAKGKKDVEKALGEYSDAAAKALTFFADKKMEAVITALDSAESNSAIDENFPR